MSVEIVFNDLWTYRSIKSNGREPLSMLDSTEYTHIHGEFQLIINGQQVPKLGYQKNKEVCLGYWIEGLSCVVRAFKQKQKEYVIWGWEQGFPPFRFEKLGKRCILTVSDSIVRRDRIVKEAQYKYEFEIEELYAAFDDFKERFLNVIEVQAPNVLVKWTGLFEKGNFSYDEKY